MKRLLLCGALFSSLAFADVQYATVNVETMTQMDTFSGCSALKTEPYMVFQCESAQYSNTIFSSAGPAHATSALILLPEINFAWKECFLIAGRGHKEFNLICDGE